VVCGLPPGAIWSLEGMMKFDDLSGKQEAMRLRQKNSKQEAKTQRNVLPEPAPSGEVEGKSSQPCQQSRPCATCGNETTNPRFCSRSCASINKTTQPTLRLQGECARCWVALSRKKEYCLDCIPALTAEKDERRRRLLQNYQSWLTPTGEQKEAPIPQVTSTILIKTYAGIHGHELVLTPERPAGELIDALIAICFSRPPYLHEHDALRYISLLNELRGFRTIQPYSPKYPSPETTLDKLQIDHLAPALQHWVYSYFREGHHEMMPAYALDTARFVQAFIGQESSYVADRQTTGEPTDNWKLEPLVMMRKDGYWARSQLLFDTSFKRDFSRRFGPRVRCQVPDGGSLNLREYPWLKELPRWKSGDRFVFRINRCHLTADSWDQGLDLFTCEEKHKPHFDLMEEFQFYGEIYPNEFTVRITGTVPGRWITDAARYSRGDELFVPVPRWSPQISQATETSHEAPPQL
jgi:hypothetical protein